MPALNDQIISRISARGLSGGAIAGLGLATGVIISLLIALLIWMKKR
jgi:hypothetical protein